MRLVVLGTGPFAVPALRRLHSEGRHSIERVVTRPPRGRRGPLAPMALAAAELDLPLWQPETINADDAREEMARARPELLVVCDYGEILKPATLEAAPRGAINLHGSLLPKYRGAAPVQWAILNGETETGNTVIQMTPGLDAGPCLARQSLAIDPNETAGQLEARLAEAGAELLLDVIEQIETDTAKPTPQDASQASKAPRLTKEHGRVDWSQTALAIKNQVRALQPWPRAYTFWQDDADDSQRLILHRVELHSQPVQAQTPGLVIQSNERLLVAAGDGAVELLSVQAAGGRPMTAGELLRGRPIPVGTQFK